MNSVTPHARDSFAQVDDGRRWGVPYVAETRFPRGLFNANEKMRFDAVNGLYF